MVLGVFKQRSFVMPLHCYQNQQTPLLSNPCLVSLFPSSGHSPAAGRGVEAVPSAPVVAGVRGGRVFAIRSSSPWGGGCAAHPTALQLGSASGWLSTRLEETTFCCYAVVQPPTCKIWVLQLVYNKVRTIVVFNNNNCCVEPRGDTAGAAELRRRLAVAVFMEKIAPRLRTRIPSGRPRARARAGRVGGALATRVFRLEPTSLLMLGARLLPLCHRRRKR